MKAEQFEVGHLLYRLLSHRTRSLADGRLSDDARARVLRLHSSQRLASRAGSRGTSRDTGSFFFSLLARGDDRVDGDVPELPTPDPSHTVQRPERKVLGVGTSVELLGRFRQRQPEQSPSALLVRVHDVTDSDVDPAVEGRLSAASCTTEEPPLPLFDAPSSTSPRRPDSSAQMDTVTIPSGDASRDISGDIFSDT
jgi:hypothetical protein